MELPDIIFLRNRKNKFSDVTWSSDVIFSDDIEYIKSSKCIHKRDLIKILRKVAIKLRELDISTSSEANVYLISVIKEILNTEKNHD